MGAVAEKAVRALRAIQDFQIAKQMGALCPKPVGNYHVLLPSRDLKCKVVVTYP